MEKLPLPLYRRRQWRLLDSRLISFRGHFLSVWSHAGAATPACAGCEDMCCLVVKECGRGRCRSCQPRAGRAAGYFASTLKQLGQHQVPCDHAPIWFGTCASAKASPPMWATGQPSRSAHRDFACLQVNADEAASKEIEPEQAIYLGARR
jgi:hypothetical protein